MNHMHCLPIALGRVLGICNCIVSDEFSMVQKTEILNVIEVLCPAGTSLEIPSNTILLLHC